MNYESVPIIRFEIENLKHQVATMLGIIGSELNDAISSEMEKAVADYDFEKEVRQAVNECLNEAIHNYWKYGKGREAIQQAVKEAIEK